MEAIWFAIGFLAGMFLMCYAARQERRESDERNKELLALAKGELDAAEAELVVKQNVIAAQEQKLRRLEQKLRKRKKTAEPSPTRQDGGNKEFNG